MFQCGYGVGEKAPAAHTCSCGALARRILSQASFRCDLGYISTLLFSHTRSLHLSPSFAPSSSRADFPPTCTVQTPSLFRCSAPLRLPFSAKILPLLWLLFSILTRCPVHFCSLLFFSSPSSQLSFRFCDFLFAAWSPSFSKFPSSCEMWWRFDQRQSL